MFSPQEMFGSRRPPRPFESGPREAGPAAGPVVEATVKWFNGTKGFGFTELADGSGDAFLHVAVLQAAGHDSVAPGAKLRVKVGRGAKGPQIVEVLEVDSSTAVPQPSRGPSQSGTRGPRRRIDESAAVELSGVTKWFNPDKGFGFVAVGDGGKDVFVHVTVLSAAGLQSLPEGQRVTMRVVETLKGREAISISLAD